MVEFTEGDGVRWLVLMGYGVCAREGMLRRQRVMAPGWGVLVFMIPPSAPAARVLVAKALQRVL